MARYVDCLPLLDEELQAFALVPAPPPPHLRDVPPSFLAVAPASRAALAPLPPRLDGASEDTPDTFFVLSPRPGFDAKVLACPLPLPLLLLSSCRAALKLLRLLGATSPAAVDCADIFKPLFSFAAGVSTWPHDMALLDLLAAAPAAVVPAGCCCCCSMTTPREDEWAETRRCRSSLASSSAVASLCARSSTVD